MAQRLLENGEEKGVFRGKLNDNFDELYNAKHYHDNKGVLNKFREENGQLLFGDNAVKGEAGADATINGVNVIKIADSDTVAVEIVDGTIKFHVINAEDPRTTGMLFLSRQEGNAVLTNEMPTESQEIIGRDWIPVIWGQWAEVVSFVMAGDVADKEVAIVPGNRFFSKLWLSSDVERPNAQLRLTVTDSSDGTELATASTIVNLLNISSILTPAVFDTKYKVSKTIPLSQMVITLSVMVLANGVQFGIVSNPPNEKSYVAPISINTNVSGLGASFPDIPPNDGHLYLMRNGEFTRTRQPGSF